MKLLKLILTSPANQTRFILLYDNVNEPLPLDLPPKLQYRSILRVQLDDSYDSHPAGSLPNPSLSDIFSKIAAIPHLKITRADRRPSLSPRHFHDAVFVEVQGSFPEQSTDVEKEQTWKSALSTCIAIIRGLFGVQNGYNGDVTSLGSW